MSEHFTVMNFRSEKRQVVVVQEFHDQFGVCLTAEHRFNDLEGEQRTYEQDIATAWMKLFNIPFSKRASLSIHI